MKHSPLLKQRSCFHKLFYRLPLMHLTGIGVQEQGHARSFRASPVLDRRILS